MIQAISTLMINLKILLPRTGVNSAILIRFLHFSSIIQRSNFQICGLWWHAMIIKDSQIGLVFQIKLCGVILVRKPIIYGVLSNKMMGIFQDGIII